MICCWTGRLPADCRQAADEILLGAAAAGMELPELAALAAEILDRSPSDTPDEDRDGALEDRGVRLVTTFGGAGVLSGDLTPECAAVAGAVLDALSAPCGAQDTRTREQRYHDALQEAMRRLVAAGLLPERAGQPVKALVHVSLADLIGLDGSSALMGQWTARVRAAWAAHRAAASVSGSDGGAWLDGDPARAFTCDASLTPVVTGEVNPAALDELVRLCAQLGRLHHHSTGTGTGTGGGGDGGDAAARPGRACPAPPALGTPWSRPSSARPWTWSRVRAGSQGSCAAGSSARGWAGRACRWTSGSARTSRPRSAAPSSCGTSTAGSPAAATSPPPPARSTT